LALLALNRDGVSRGAAAETLWPDCTPARAAANLRTALCQGRKICSATAIDSVGHRLQLASSVTSDLHLAWAKARQIIAGLSEPPRDCEAYIGDLNQELLPGWSDEWLTGERERWEQVRQHALESLALQFQVTGQYLPAIECALAAIAIDPMRENAHRILIAIYADEGNVACAVKRYRQYETLLREELGVAPSAQMTRLIEKLLADSSSQHQMASMGMSQRESAMHSRSLELQQPDGSHPSRRIRRAHHQQDSAHRQGQRRE
jgi:DNA-binding SARP family transcriptional activator